MNNTTTFDTAVTILQLVTPIIVALLMYTLKGLTTAIKELKTLIETIQRDFNSMLTEITLLKSNISNIKTSIADIESDLEKTDTIIRQHHDTLLQLKNAHNSSDCSKIKIN